MNKLAQDIPGLKDVFQFQAEKTPEFKTLGDVLSGLLNIFFYIAVFVAFYWLIWASFQYILASGKKEELAKARTKITWTLVGLVIIFSAYFLAKYAAQILPPGRGGLPF